MKTYILIGADGKRYESATPGTLGGHNGACMKVCNSCPSLFKCHDAQPYVVSEPLFTLKQVRASLFLSPL